MKTQPDHQLSLGPMPLANETQGADERVNHTHDEPARPKCTPRDDAQHSAAALFDHALTASGLTTGEVSFILGISESLVRRMRSADARERPSFVQILMMPPSFHLELHRALNRRFGFGKAALSQLLEAAGLLAVGIE